MPKLIKQPQKPSKPTVMKPITRQCNGCFEEKTTAHRHCKCTYTTCNACLKGWIIGHGGVVDTTGKFVYTCPQCRRHLDISPSMLQDADVNQKFANLLEETEDSEEEDEPEETEILVAINNYNWDRVEEMTQQDTDLVNYRSPVSDIIVSHKIARGSPQDLAREIFSNPATDLNCMDYNGIPLHCYDEVEQPTFEVIIGRVDYEHINHVCGLVGTYLHLCLQYPETRNGLQKAYAMINNPKIDLLIRNNVGKTALDIAREKGLDDIAAMIESKIAIP